MALNILIGADLVPTESNYHLFNQGAVAELIGADLQTKLVQCDFSIFNLEAPITDVKEPIDKCGPNLIIPTSCIEGIKAINPHFFTLANNHILDHGSQGLFSTMEILEKNGICYAGVGRNLDEAKEPFILEKGGVKIGVYCCAEHEFSIATESTPGVNPFDALESLDHISDLKKECDYVIVLYHGGKEHYRYPSPYLQKVCRKIVDKGADLVVCQHSHCIGCCEEWNAGTIVYGQGNFLFDDCDNEFWNTSLLIDLNIEKKNGVIKTSLSYIPLAKSANKVRLAKTEKDVILSQFRERSNQISDSEFVEKRYDEFAQRMLNQYLYSLIGKTSRRFLFRVINKLSGYRYGRSILNRKYDKRSVLSLINYIECEAHRELFQQGLHSKLKE